jgi:putative flippase GtrA
MIKYIYKSCQKNKNEIFRFIIVGSSLFILSNSLYLIIKNLLFINYIVSISITNAICVFIHYLLNKNFTYKSEKFSQIQLIKYFMYLLFNYFLSILFGYFFITILNFNSNFLIFYTTPFTMISSYLLMKFFVFRKI